jgi:hypothetical protein
LTIFAKLNNSLCVSWENQRWERTTQVMAGAQSFYDIGFPFAYSTATYFIFLYKKLNVTDEWWHIILRCPVKITLGEMWTRSMPVLSRNNVLSIYLFYRFIDEVSSTFFFLKKKLLLKLYMFSLLFSLTKTFSILLIPTAHSLTVLFIIYGIDWWHSHTNEASLRIWEF